MVLGSILSRMLTVLFIVGFSKKPALYQWKKSNASGNGKHFEFFQYSVKLGRNLLLQSKYKCPAAMKHWTANNVNELQLTKFWKLQIMWMNCSCRKKWFVFIGCWCIMLFLLVIGWGKISNMLVEWIVVHPRNLFCICFGYVPKSSNSGVSCFYYWDTSMLVLLSHGVSFMEMLWSMKVCMLLMFFTFPMGTFILLHFHLLFHGLELKIWLFGVLLRH